MSYNLVVKPEAERDIQEAAQYYQLQQSGLGLDFLLAADQCLSRVQEGPLLYAVKYQDVRTASLKRFPFLVHFYVEADTVIVLAVLHSKRNPRNWKDQS